jgi:hypothetical protein
MHGIDINFSMLGMFAAQEGCRLGADVAII